MIAGILKETCPGERRVALVPAAIASLTKLGLKVALESGAGVEAGLPDAAFAEKEVQVFRTRDELLQASDIVLQVRSLIPDRGGFVPALEGLRAGQVVIGFLDPLGRPEAAKALAAKGVAAFSLELVPRITRAQAMDALSSMATIVGYKAVLLAAEALPRIFPMLMTAAGTIAPAKVFVIGGGVAGLQAIATAKRLGAVVEAYDIRPAVKEQVQSLGARFVELPLEAGETQDAGGYAKAMDEAFYKRQRELLSKVVAANDVVITTAAVPGKKAPVLVTSEMVRGMQPGSVVGDVAAEQGGNCELTRPGETVTEGGVSILGPLNLASSVPFHASQMLARNIANLLALLVKKGELKIDLEDQVLAESLVSRDGEVVNPRVREALGLAPLAAAAPPAQA